MDIKININSIDELYQEALNFEVTGNENQFKSLDEDKESFRGLSIEEILKSKYSYNKGLDDLHKIQDFDANIGRSGRKRKWSEQDGDDMSIERLNEGLPFMEQRVRCEGDRIGKFISIYVNICECCRIDYQDMLYKSYTTISLIDYLESLNYKVAVYLLCEAKNMCSKYKGNDIKIVSIEIQIKKFDEPLIKGLILTCISPWMFRYWIFKLWTAKFNTNYGLGQPLDTKHDSNTSTIYINTGECLSKDSADDKIEQIKKLFIIEE